MQIIKFISRFKAKINRRRAGFLDYKAVTKIQAVILASIIAVASISSIAAYYFWSQTAAPSETIKIGVCADIDNIIGKQILQGVILATEQVNTEGGILGRNFEVVTEDDDSEIGADIDLATNALNRLIFVDEADFIITGHGIPKSVAYQDITANHKKIHLFVNANSDDLTQRVLDDYDTYKYSFRTGPTNRTSWLNSLADSMVTCRMYTGFNKVGILCHWFLASEVPNIISALEEYGFEVDFFESVEPAIDYSSYFVHAEVAGTEILLPLIWDVAAVPFVKEYNDRQSPMVIWGQIFSADRNTFWNETDGKCEYTTVSGQPIVAGYPLTSKTLPIRDAYFERWSEEISSVAACAYDTVRFILHDAIRRAGTIEKEAVISALEKTDIETSIARRFVFTSSHDIMVGEEYYLFSMFQWQNGVQVPVYPTEIMEDVGATFMYPSWPGPWD